MELVSEDVHRTLTYLAAVGRKGAQLSIGQLQKFAASPQPFPARTRNVLADYAARSLTAFFEQAQPGETTTAFLQRVEWIELSSGSVRLTQLGVAVLEHADRPALVDPADEPMSVTIDPDDPLAYARIFHLLAGHGPGLLVDPYLKFDGLADIMQISSIDRVLTSNDDGRNRLGIFARALGASTEPPALRTLDRSQLHDRFFIPDDGPVYTLGSSLNSITKRPGVVTPIADAAAAGAIRAAYADLWSQADEVAAAAEEPASS